MHTVYLLFFAGLSTQGNELTRRIEKLKSEMDSLNKKNKDLLNTKEEMESQIDALNVTVKEKEEELKAVRKMLSVRDMQMRQLSRGSASSPELEKQAPLSHDIESLTKEKQVLKNHSDMCTQTEKHEVHKSSKASAKLTGITHHVKSSGFIIHF